MAVDWKTLEQTPDGWRVQDINGKDWFPISHFALTHPGELIDQLFEDNRILEAALKQVKATLLSEPMFIAARIAETALTKTAKQ